LAGEDVVGTEAKAEGEEEDMLKEDWICDFA